MLEAVYPVERRLGELADTVQSAYQHYGEMARLREPLKTSFTLTLTLVLLLALLAAMYGAFFSAQRLVRPVQDLIAGTRAVGKGDFDTRLPLPSHDEMGFLVHSFNDMTKRLRARARRNARAASTRSKRERARLAIILARLSTGVISLEPDLHGAHREPGGRHDPRRQTSTASSASRSRKPARAARCSSSSSPRCSAHLDAGETEWREQLVLQAESSRRMLMCACTTLPGEDRSPGGYVIVFDDITALLQAQRDAAWGEVARRLAHEIKNPLTPIQLSAERMRRKLLAHDERRGCADARPRHAHHRAAGRGDEADGERVQRIRARAGDAVSRGSTSNALIAEVADLYRVAGVGRVGHRARARSAHRPRSRPTAAACGRSSTICFINALEALEGVPRAAARRRDAAASRPATRRTPTITVDDNGPGFQRERAGPRVRPLRHQQAQGHGPGARDREEDRRRARRAASRPTIARKAAARVRDRVAARLTASRQRTDARAAYAERRRERHERSTHSGRR